MIGYKLFRVKRNGSLGSLFINRSDTYDIGKRYVAKTHPTKGFAVRPGWHICSKPVAPHLSMKGRAWYRVEFSGSIKEHIRPASQGGLWYTSKYMKIVEKI